MRLELAMGCLVLLILAIVFRGAIFALLSSVIGIVVGMLSLVLSLGFWGIIIIFVLCAVVAALD